jgi:arylsulfatase A-like enzyme
LGSVHSGEGAPNILFVLFDDTGLAAWSPFGGRISMPTLQKLADYGLMDSQWHTTALCSPTRSTLLTGRNHHLNGMAAITEATIGFPGANGRIPDQCATLGHIRQHGGWSTFWLGKNHNVFEGDIAAGASKKEWPLQKGFDRYYGFIGGETNQRIRISSRTIATWIRATPEEPWYLWFCPGANHAPHHCPQDFSGDTQVRCKGRFDSRMKAVTIRASCFQCSRKSSDVRLYDIRAVSARCARGLQPSSKRPPVAGSRRCVGTR